MKVIFLNDTQYISSITEQHSKTFENRVSGDVARHVLASKLVPFAIWIFFEKMLANILFILQWFLLTVSNCCVIILTFFSGHSQEGRKPQKYLKKFQQDIERSDHKFSCLTGETCSRKMFLLITSQTVRTPSWGKTFYL